MAGKQYIKNLMKKYCLIPILISIFITALITTPYHSIPTSALTYQDTLDTSFTFNSSVSISLSSADLVISELTPNTYSDSNIITVTTATNNRTGYTLTATAGDGSTYTDTDLVDNDNVSNTDVFGSLSTTESYDITTSDFNPGKWGYSFSTDSGTTWINANGVGYSGLPYYGNAGANILTTSTSGTSSLQFKIGAKATATQLAGTYNNVINFTAVTNYVPTTIDDLVYMQDFNTLTTTQMGEVLDSMVQGQQYQLVDNRDNTKYWIAKQADDKVWMTQNLDLCVGCSGTATLTSENTDLNVMGSGAGSDIYIVDYSESGEVITWSPQKTGTTANDASPITSDQVIKYTSLEPGDYSRSVTWSNSDTKPWSAEGGERYYYAPETNTDDTPSNTCDNGDNGKDWCKHYHAGNYYNWTEAIASSNSTNLNTNYSTAKNSICPAGWRLPIGASSATATAETREFGQLLYTSKITTALSTNNYATDGAINIRKTPVFLTRSGSLWSNSLNDSAQYGYYWSSTINSASKAHYLLFRSPAVYAPLSDYRFVGTPLRCLLR